MVEYFVEQVLSNEKNVLKLEEILSKNEKISTSLGNALVLIANIDKSFNKDTIMFAVINDIKSSNSKKKNNEEQPSIYLKPFNYIPNELSVSELEIYIKERIFNSKMTDCNKQPFNSRSIPTCSFTDLYVKWPKINKINKFEEILTKFPCVRKKVDDVFENIATNSFGLEKEYSSNEERVNYLLRIEEYLKTNYQDIHNFIAEQAVDHKIEYVRLMFTTSELFMTKQEMQIIRNEKLLWMGNMLTKNGKILVGVNQNENKPLICSFNVNINKGTINDSDLKKAYLLDLTYMFMKTFKSKSAKKEVIQSFELDELHKEILLNKTCICGDGTSADLYEDYYETPSYRKSKDLKFIVKGKEAEYELNCFQLIDRFFFTKEGLGNDEESKEKIDMLIKSNKHFLEYCKNTIYLSTQDLDKLYKLANRLFELFIGALKNNSNLSNYKNTFLNKKALIESMNNELRKRGIKMETKDTLMKFKNWHELKNETEYSIESDEEYYFIAGQLAYYIENKKGGTHALTVDDITVYLTKKNNDNFKECLLRRLETYAYKVDIRNITFRKIISAFLSFKPNTNIDKNKIYFMHGVFSENIFYFKNTITEEAKEA